MEKKKRDIPILYKNKEDCCGCTACVSICGAQAIVMIEDEEGFDYPFINEMKCSRCYRCVQICPMNRVTADLEV